MSISISRISREARNYKRQLKLWQKCKQLKEEEKREEEEEQ